MLTKEEQVMLQKLITDESSTHPSLIRLRTATQQAQSNHDKGWQNHRDVDYAVKAPEFNAHEKYSVR